MFKEVVNYAVYEGTVYLIKIHFAVCIHVHLHSAYFIYTSVNMTFFALKQSYATLSSIIILVWKLHIYKKR